MAITASTIHLFKGRKIRVVYVGNNQTLEQTPAGPAVVWDDFITPEVLLIDYHPSTQEVEIQRAGKLPERMKFKELIGVD